MKILLLLAIVALIAGCTSLEKGKNAPPSVSTAQVIQSLSDTKQELVLAGESNTIVAQKIDKALSLAERLDAILAQIENTNQVNKNVIKPE
jgi:outer membrane murein-binding lipoprotein Lpp